MDFYSIFNCKRFAVLWIFLIIICLAPLKYGNVAENGEQIFQDYCTSCHTIGKGILVGPDLAGVTSRREENWLLRQIKEPDVLIEEEDSVAMQLLQDFDDMPMVNLGLSNAEVKAVISYLKSIEQQLTVSTSIPSKYFLTILISILLLIGITFVGLRAGKKKVDVR
jgi:cytochrome c5